MLRFAPFPTLLVLSICCLIAETEESTWAERLKLETHGFASFGYIHTGPNNWLGDTTEGTTEFYEAALNLIARPAERWRLGAQLFVRDLVDYDNGTPQLDWAYLDYRASDVLGIQGGRIKFPVGFHNEAWDVDAARTPIFLPRSIYDQRYRDLFISIDGAKIYGSTEAGNGRYTLYGGAKTLDPQAGFGTFFERGTGFVADTMTSDFVLGGMGEWSDFERGLCLRLSWYHLDGLSISGTMPDQPISTHLTADYDLAIASLRWEDEQLTIENEWQYRYGTGENQVEELGLRNDYSDQYFAASLSCDWHLNDRCDLYAAVEYSELDNSTLSKTLSEYSFIGAIAYRPLANWSIKAEIQGVDGEVAVLIPENPDGIEQQWWLLALKTTVDF